MLNLSSGRGGKRLLIAGYILLVTAFLVRGWIPILLLVIMALIAERRESKTGAEY